jgi:C_GCAxxG_C_C family probable redox protein
MTKSEKAVQCFNNGFNCSQAVFSVYSEQFDVNTELGLKTASGFGAGMGRQCETCGAVSGAFMIIGLKYGHISSVDKDGKEKTYSMIREFARRFKERNQSTCCEDLLGTHMVTGDKEKAARQVKLTCPKFVQDSAEILDELLE